jgi:hypothetical protein
MPKLVMPTTAKEWNNRYPRGTKVKFYPKGKYDGATSIETETKGAAYHTSSGRLCVPLKGFGEFGAGKPAGSIEIIAQTAPQVDYEAMLTALSESLRRAYRDGRFCIACDPNGPYEP